MIGAPGACGNGGAAMGRGLVQIAIPRDPATGALITPELIGLASAAGRRQKDLLNALEAADWSSSGPGMGKSPARPVRLMR